MAIKVKNKFGQWVSAENVPIVPSALSQLINDSHFIKLLQLDELPEVGENDTLYITPILEEELPIGYSIYIWENNTWKNLSSCGTEVLSKYYTKNETNTLLNNKVSVEEGKGLSTNDYTTEEKNKLATIESGATRVENTSDIINDSGFINNTVDNLTNYYLKSQIYTKIEIDSLLESITKDTIQVVQTLPSTGEPNIIYLVPKESSPTDSYDEYLWINNQWEHIGSTNKGDGIVVVNNTTEIDSLYTQFGICDLSLIWTGDETLYTYQMESSGGSEESTINLVSYEIYSISVNIYNDTQTLKFTDKGNIKGEKGDKGDNYILTKADKQEIADLISASIVDGNEVEY